MVALVCASSLLCIKKKNAIVDRSVWRVAFHAVICTMIAHGWCKHCKETPFTKSAPHLGFFVGHGCCCVCLRLVCCGCAVWRATFHWLQCAEHTAAPRATSTLYCTKDVISSMHAPLPQSTFNDPSTQAASWYQKYLKVEALWGRPFWITCRLLYLRISILYHFILLLHSISRRKVALLTTLHL